MTKKKVDISRVQSELSKGSVFFNKFKQNNENKEPIRTVETNDTNVSNDTSVRSYDRTEKRLTKRHPFEIYEDQLLALQRLKAQSTLDGRTRNLSDMVRTAIDNFLQNENT